MSITGRPGTSEMQGVVIRPGTQRLNLKEVQGEVSLFDSE